MPEFTKEELEPAEVVLQCMVPVYIVMEAGEIRKVVVDDENLDLPNAKIYEHSSVGGKLTLEAARVAHAIKQAQEGDWPAWQFGW